MDGGIETGTVVAGRYRVVRPLGQGGSGDTYAAETVGGGGLVALKRFRLKGASSWKALELFEREARVLASLAHPCIPAYVESFTVDGPEGPEFYLAQTLAPGQTLADWIAGGGRVDEKQVKALAEQLLVVLGYLHGLHPPVIHRDLKPANIIRGSEGQLSVVDFGAVRDVAADSVVGGTTVVGTYGFMAPEQFRGLASPAADLYSLGATLVFLLTHVSPDRLPQKKLRPELPKSLGLSKSFRAWLEKLLEPAPEDRFASAREALTALRLGRIERPGANKRIALLAGLLVAVLGGAGVGAMEIRKRLPVPEKLPVQAPGAKRADSLLPEPTRGRVTTLKATRSFVAHTAVIQELQFSPDGKLLASGSFDGTVKLWATADWSLVRTLTGHGGRVTGVRFTGDGKSIVSSGEDGSVRLWSVETGAEVASVKTAPLRSLALSPASDRVVVGDVAGGLASYSLPALTPGWTTIEKEPRGARAVLSIAFSPDGKLVASGGDLARIDVRNAEDGALRFSHHDHSRSVDRVLFAPDGNRIVSVADDGNMVFWDFARPNSRFTVRQSNTEVWSGVFDAKGGVLYTGDKDGRLVVRDHPNLSMLLQWDVAKGRGLSALGLSPDGHTLLTGLATGYIQVFALPDADASKVPACPPNLPKKIERPDKELPARRAEALLDDYAGERGTLDEARGLAERALTDDPKNALALTELGRVAVKSSFQVGWKYDTDALKRAGTFFDKALEADPHLSEAHRARGYWLLFSARNERARLDRKESADLPPLDLVEARREAELAEAGAPGSYAVELLRADIAEAEHRGDDALRYATHVVESARDEEAAMAGYEELIRVYRALGMAGAEEAVYRRLLELEPHDAWLRGNFASALHGWGRVSECVAMASDALAIRSYGAAHATRAGCHADQGISDLWDFRLPVRARERFQAALKDNPRSVDARYGLVAVAAFEAAEKGETCKTCEDDLKAVLKLDPDYAPAKAALATPK